MIGLIKENSEIVSFRMEGKSRMKGGKIMESKNQKKNYFEDIVKNFMNDEDVYIKTISSRIFKDSVYDCDVVEVRVSTDADDYFMEEIASQEMSPKPTSFERKKPGSYVYRWYLHTDYDQDLGNLDFESLNKQNIKEDLDEDVRDDLTHDLFNAIGDVLFKYKKYPISADEFEEIMNFVTDRLNDSDDDYFYESYRKVNESTRKKYTQRQLRKLVDQGDAEDITNYSFEEANDLYDRGYDVVGVSSGTYGMNGALLKMRDTDELMAICARNSTLMQLV